MKNDIYDSVVSHEDLKILRNRMNYVFRISNVAILPSWNDGIVWVLTNIK